jgi:putative ABC transport system permease protein
MLFMIGTALLGPVFVVPMTWIAGRVLSAVTGVTGDLARWNARRVPLRVASVMSPLMLAVGFASLMVCFSATIQTATVDQTNERTIADLLVIPSNEGLPLEVEHAIAEIPGVQSANSVLPTSAARIVTREAESELQEFPAVGVDPATIGFSQSFTFESGGLNTFGPGSVLLSEMAADTFKVDSGERVMLYLADMTTISVSVAGVYSNSLGFADVVFARDDVAPHVISLLADIAYVDVAQDADAVTVARQISTLTSDGYQLEIIGRDAFIDSIRQGLDDDEWVTNLIIGSAALFASLSVVNTMTMSTFERSREFALMRLNGATIRQVLSMIGSESAIVLAIGAITGVGIAVASMISVSVGLTGDMSALTVPTVPILGIVSLAAAVSLAAHIIPARFALRTDPMSQIGSKE